MKMRAWRKVKRLSQSPLLPSHRLSCDNVGGCLQWSSGKEDSREMQRRRHDRGSEEGWLVFLLWCHFTSFPLLHFFSFTSPSTSLLSSSLPLLSFHHISFFSLSDFIQLIAAQVGTRPEKIRLQKWYTIFKDHITIEDYEIHDGMGLELYYN